MLYLLYTRWMAKISRRRLSTRRLWFSNIVTFNLAVLNMSHTVFQSIDWLIMLKNKISMSQSLWQKIEKPDLNVVFNVFFFFFFFFSEQQTFQIWVDHSFALFSMKYGTWFLGEQATRQNTKLKKSVVQSVLLCLSCLFIYILTSKFIKKLKKNKQAKKN